MNYSRAEAKAWTRTELRGYVLTVTTPFRDNLEIDEAGLRRNVEHMMGLPGTGGLYVASLYQEFWTLTLKERKRVTEIVVDTAAGRAPVIVGVTDTSLPNVVELARHAAAVGADLLMLWPPYYGVRDWDGVRRFYETVAEAVDLGICVYSTSLGELGPGYPLGPEQLRELAEIDTVCAVKELSLSLSGYAAAVEAVGELLVVSCPLEEYLHHGAATFGFDLVQPLLLGTSRPLYLQSRDRPHCGEFLTAMEARDLSAAGEAMRAITRLARLLGTQRNIGLTKYMTELMGMAGGPPRPPLPLPTAAQRAAAREVMLREGLLRAG